MRRNALAVTLERTRWTNQPATSMPLNAQVPALREDTKTTQQRAILTRQNASAVKLERTRWTNQPATPMPLNAQAPALREDIKTTQQRAILIRRNASAVPRGSTSSIRPSPTRMLPSAPFAPKQNTMLFPGKFL
tara:strand:- start:1297 stop:1698 length:402 start_codon:yes stop_codon:yes gene_type:complete